MTAIKYTDSRYLDGTFPLLAQATPGSAGYDVRACIEEDVVLMPDEVVKIPLGFALDIQDSGICVMLLPRSGLGTQGLILGNTIGLIDSDYQGQITAPMWNRTNEPMTIHAGDRIGQIIFTPVIHPKLNVVAEFASQTVRGENGFNSTGTK